MHPIKYMLEKGFRSQQPALDLIIIHMKDYVGRLTVNGHTLTPKVGPKINLKTLFHASPAGIAFLSGDEPVNVDAEGPGQEEIVNLIMERNRILGIEMPFVMYQWLIERGTRQAEQERKEREQAQSDLSSLAKAAHDLDSDFPLPNQETYLLKDFSYYLGISEDTIAPHAKDILSLKGSYQGEGPIKLDKAKARQLYVRLKHKTRAGRRGFPKSIKSRSSEFLRIDEKGGIR